MAPIGSPDAGSGSVTPSTDEQPCRTDGGAPRPNVLLFVTDDLGWRMFDEEYGVPTPTLDSMAEEGASFEQFYGQPVCTPTRSCLLTGRYPWRTGTVERPHQKTTNGMWPDERTLAELLGSAGYETWLTGKWHLGQWYDEHLPQNRGFDHHYGIYTAMIDHFTHCREGVLDWHRNGEPVVEEGYATDLLAEEAISLLDAHDGENPFFLMVPWTAVHWPYQAPAEYTEPYSDDEMTRNVKGMFEAMDESMGEVLDALAANGYAGDTLTMFVNDHGPGPGHPVGPQRGDKGTFYEGGVRVPAFATWPGHIEPGTVVDEVVHSVDVYPTIANLAGGSLDQDLPIDGVDVWSTIADGDPSPRDEILFDPNVVRQGRWKLIDAGTTRYDMNVADVELYDLEADPMESENVAGANPGVVESLRERLETVRSETRMHGDLERIPDFPPAVYGKSENEQYGEDLRRGEPCS